MRVIGERPPMLYCRGVNRTERDTMDTCNEPVVWTLRPEDARLIEVALCHEISQQHAYAANLTHPAYHPRPDDVELAERVRTEADRLAELRDELRLMTPETVAP